MVATGLLNEGLIASPPQPRTTSLLSLSASWSLASLSSWSSSASSTSVSSRRSWYLASSSFSTS